MTRHVSEDVFGLAEMFAQVHLSCADVSENSPRRFLSFIYTYLHIYESRITTITEQQGKLQVRLPFFKLLFVCLEPL